MIKNVLVQVGERVEIRQRVVPATYDEEGRVLMPETVEDYEELVPIMEPRNVEMTPEEIAEFERMAAEMPVMEPSLEERVATTEAVADMAYVNSELALAMLEMEV